MDTSIKIISGFKITESELNEMWKQNISFDYQQIDHDIFIGQILFIGYRGDPLSIELLRDYSTTDTVRTVRFTLMKINPEKFSHVYPKMFTV